jgi:hypothetical protein
VRNLKLNYESKPKATQHHKAASSEFENKPLLKTDCSQKRITSVKRKKISHKRIDANQLACVL